MQYQSVYMCVCMCVTLHVPGQWMEPLRRDWLLIIALDVGGMWREDEIIGGADSREGCQRPVPDTHTHTPHLMYTAYIHTCTVFVTFVGEEVIWRQPYVSGGQCSIQGDNKHHSKYYKVLLDMLHYTWCVVFHVLVKWIISNIYITQYTFNTATLLWHFEMCMLQYLWYKFG